MSAPVAKGSAPVQDRAHNTVPFVEPGLYVDGALPKEDFIFGFGVSYSALKAIDHSPLYWRESTYKAPTAAQQTGSLVDEAVLEPQQFDQRYEPVPDDLRRGTKDWKAREEAAKEAGKVLVKHKDYQQALGVRERLYSDHRLGALLEAAQRHPRMFWRDPATGVMCKAEADLLVPELRLMLDLKTCGDDARPDAFARACANYDYPLQDAFYRRGYRAATKMTLSLFGLLAVELDEHGAIDFAIYELDEQDREIADARIDRLLRIYAECVKRDYWPGISTDQLIQPLSMPGWWRHKHGHVLPARSKRNPI